MHLTSIFCRKQFKVSVQIRVSQVEETQKLTTWKEKNNSLKSWIEASYLKSDGWQKFFWKGETLIEVKFSLFEVTFVLAGFEIGNLQAYFYRDSGEAGALAPV